MKKTITVDNENVSVSQPLTEEEMLQVAEDLFGWELKKNDYGQYLFHTHITDPEYTGDSPDDEDSPDSLEF